MGPPTVSMPVGQLVEGMQGGVRKEANGPLVYDIGEVAQQGARAPLPGLPAVANEEILQLVSGYFEGHGLRFRLEEEEKGAERAQLERQLLEMVLAGNWSELAAFLKALQPKVGPALPAVVCLAKRQELLELLDAQAQQEGDRQRPIPEVESCLADLKALCSEQEYEDMRQCASMQKVQDHPLYSQWTVASGRQACLEALRQALQPLDTAARSQPGASPAPAHAVSTGDRLEVLLRQALAFQALRAGFTLEAADRISRESTAVEEKSQEKHGGEGLVQGLDKHVLSAETISTDSSLGVELPAGGSPLTGQQGANGLLNGPQRGVNGRIEDTQAQKEKPRVRFTLLRDIEWRPAGAPDPFEVGTLPLKRNFLEDSLFSRPSGSLSRGTSMGGMELAAELALPVVPRVKAKVSAERKNDDEEAMLLKEASVRLTYPNQKREQANGGGDVERGRQLEEEDRVRKLELQDSLRSGGRATLDVGKEVRPRKASPPLEEERFGPTIVVTSKPPRAAKAAVDAAATKPSPAASPRVSDSIRGSAPPSPIRAKMLANWVEEGGGSRKGTPKGSWSAPPSPHGDSVDPDEYDKDVRAQYEQVKALFEAERTARGDYRGERYEEVGAPYEMGRRGEKALSSSSERGVQEKPVHSRSGELEPLKVKGLLVGERLPSPKPAKTSPRKPGKAQDYGSPSISPKHRRSSSAEKLHEAAEKPLYPRSTEKPISRSGPLDRVASNPVLSSSRGSSVQSVSSTPKAGMVRSASFVRRASAAGRAYGALDPTAGFASTTVLKDTQPVRTVAWDRDGNFLAVGSNSRTLRICHVWGITGEEPASRSSREHTKPGVPGAKVVVEERDWHMGSVYTVGWNCTGGLVATGSNDQTLKVASVQRARGEDYGNLYFGVAGIDDIGESTFEGHDGTIRDLAFSPVAENLVLSGGAGDFGLRYWDVEGGMCVSTLWSSTAAIFAMRIAPDGRTVLTGGGESSLRIWDLRTASCVRTMGHYTAQVSSLALGWESPGGPQVVAGFADGTCRVVDFGSGKETRKLTHHTADCRSVDISPGGRWLLTGGFDGSIGIVDARSGWHVARVYRAHGDKVIQSRWHPGGVGFATSSADRTVRVWGASRPSDEGE